MEPGAMLFARGDHTTFPALYLQVVDGVRPDVVIADKYGYPEPHLLAGLPPDLRRTPLGKEQREYWIFAHTDRPIYVAEQRPIPEEIGTLVPAGVLYRLVRPGEAWQPPADLWDRYAWHTLDPRATHGNWSAEAILTDTYYSLGRHRLAAGDVPGARAAFDDLLVAAGGENVVDLTNIGASFVERRRWAEAAEFLERALRLDPRYVPALKNLTIVWAAQGDCRRALGPLDELARLGAASREEGELRATCRAELGVGPR
jgi:tetratricopeptide (TPR) repeat protein